MSALANPTPALSPPKFSPTYELQRYYNPTLPRKTPVNAISVDLKDDLLRACDSALTACSKALESKNNVIKGQAELLAEQETQINQLKADQSSIIKSPALWFIVGAAVTGITIAIIKR